MTGPTQVAIGMTSSVADSSPDGPRIVLFANTEWYLYNFRRSLAKSLRAAGARPLLISPPGPYGQKLRDLGFEWTAVPMRRRSLNPLREIALIAHLVRLFRRERPALMHAFTIKCAVYGSIAARLARVPARVNAVAGMGYVFTSDDVRARLLRPIVRLLLRLALDSPQSFLVLQNNDDIRLFEMAGLVSRSRTRLIRGSGVDCSRFTKRTSQRAPGPIRVVLATRLLWDKGLAEFIEAAKELKHEGANVEFILAGTPDPGNPASVAEAIVRQWVAERLVDWRGHVDDMPSLYHCADIVVLPSYREGLPKSLIEAAACGTALVTTDVPGCREVVTNGVDGLLVPLRDSTALAAAIRRLIDDPILRQTLGEAARAKAAREFDEQIVIDKTLAVYRELLGQQVL